MALFGWIASSQEPPTSWDLRLRGWTMCNGRSAKRAECRHVLVCDTRSLDATARAGLAEADRPAWRLIMVGVEEPAERASLLSLGCAEALPATIGLFELEARARRVSDMFGMLPRWRNVGPLTLDLFHRDARHGVRWLGLHPREFGLLWRLADDAGRPVTRAELLRDVWRLNHDPDTNSVEVHVSRLRAKLGGAGIASIVETASGGGYRLAHTERFMFACDPPEADALDRYLHDLGWAPARLGETHR